MSHTGSKRGCLVMVTRRAKGQNPYEIEAKKKHKHKTQKRYKARLTKQQLQQHKRSTQVRTELSRFIVQ